MILSFLVWCVFERGFASIRGRFPRRLHWLCLALCVVWGACLTHGQAAKPAELVNEHADFLILYQPDRATPLSLVLRDEDRGINYRPGEIVVVAAESSRITLPGGTPFGEEGESIWVLPQSQDPGLPYLGFSAERIPSGVFARPFNLRLKSVEGPGNFFAWQAAEFGGLNIKMNSRNGIGDEDKTTPIIGSHEHLNWGFSTSGVYRVTFQIDGQRFGESTNLLSEPATFEFHILPLPTVSVPTTLELKDPQPGPGGEFAFTLAGGLNRTVLIQGTRDFLLWTTVTNLIPASASTRIRVPMGGGVDASHRFYRAIAP